jgi:hypothetical protein
LIIRHTETGVYEELMVSVDIAMMAKIAGAGVAGLAAAVISAPGAYADPPVPAPPPGPDTVSASAPAPADGLQTALPPEGVPHLPSPENLPYDTSGEPVGPQSGPGTTYARDIWNSMQTQDISWKQGILLLIAQRPMNANATPPPGMSSSPQQQGPAAGPAPDGAPAPDAGPAPAGPPPLPPGYVPLNPSP